MIEQQIGDIPLSPQISPIKEQPSQEEYESSSPSETTQVVIEEKTQSQEDYESSPPSETTKVVIEEPIVATTEEDNKLTLTTPSVEETSLSEEARVVKSDNPTNEQEVDNNKGTTSAAEDEEGSPLNIGAAQLEIAKILSNSDNNNNINVEDNTDCQKETELPSSPLLTFVTYDDKLDSLQMTSASSREATSTMPLQHLEYEVIHATTWDDKYPPEQLLPKVKSSPNGEIKYGKGWQSERHCKYPQEIILQVSCGSARIRRLQILSHHYKIATKLEIYVGSVQRRKDLVGVNTNTGSSHDEKRTLSWDKFPKIIENDGMESEDEGSTNSEENDYDIIRSNNEPYILFRRLGYCALDSNERSNYRSRELKSVRLDTEGEYIRLVARRCYENHQNEHNQVGIVGITVTGEPVDHLLAGESQTIPIEHADEGVSRVASPENCIVPFIQENWMINNDPNDQRNFTSLYSILPNSLSASNNNSSTTTNPLPNDAQTNINNPIVANDFLLNGEGTEKLLAAFGRAKQNAVKVEDFQLAKFLRDFIDHVKKAAEDVCKYDALKKQAVEEEDFENADKYKQEIEIIRLEIRNMLADEGIDLDDSGEVIYDPSLLDIIGLAENAENQQSDPNVNEQDYLLATSSHIPKSRTNSNASIDRASGARAPEPILPLISKSRTSSDASMNRYLGGNNNNNYAYEQQEEPTTPTTPTHSTTPLPWTPFADDRNPSNTEAMMTHVPQNLAENEPEPLTKLGRAAFEWPIKHFGDHVVACLLSSKHHLRDSALIQVTNRIDIDADGLNVDGIDKLSLVKATYQAIQEALNDNRDEHTSQVLILWKKLIKFCVHHQIPNTSTWKFVEVNYELLFGKTSSPNDQVKQKSIDLFILLAKTYKTPTQSVLSLILKPAKTQSQPLKKAKPAIEMIIRLIEEFGVVQIQKIKFDKDNKLGHAALMEVSVSYLSNNNEEVRITAVKLVFEVVKRIGKDNVEPYLAEVEPSLLETIWALVKEWEETTGKVAGAPSTPPSPKQKPEEGKDAVKPLDVLQKPLAKRGTVDRLEQQLMEVQFRIKNTNNVDYLNAAKKPFDQDDFDEEENLRLEAQLMAEIEEIEALEAAESNIEPSPKVKGTAASKKAPTARGSKSAAPSKAAPAKKPKDDGKAAPSKKTTTSKTSAAKSVSRRGSTDDVKAPSKSARKDSVNNPNVPSKLTSEPVTDEPDELKSDRCCIFCDEHDERYTEENLVTHYWNDCPVLTNCRLCNIILEISTLDDHMLNDCDKSKFVKQCPRCREVIGADDFLEHMAKQSCMAIRQDIVRCPLCKATVKPATEAGWKAHLIDESGCTKNRRKSKASTSMVKEMEAAATAEKREKKSTSTTKSSATSKTPVRKPTAASKDKPKKASTAKVSKAKK